MADVPNVLEQTPVGGNVSAPSSGSYGEGAALDRLKVSLPGADPTQSQAAAPVPPMSGGAGPIGPPGMPPGLMSPTRQPDVPVSAPLTGPAPIIGSSPAGRAALLRALLDDPETSEESKELATRLLAQYKRLHGV